MPRSESLRCLLVLVSLVLAPAAARAGEDDDAEDDASSRSAATAAPDDDVLAQAKAHFEAGRAAYQAADYAKAIKEFQAANRLRPSPILEYNIGLAYEGLGKTAQALKRYQRYLAQKPDAPNREEVEHRIATISGAGKGRPPAPEPAGGAPVYNAAPYAPPPGYTPPPAYVPPPGYTGTTFAPYQPPVVRKKRVRRWGLFAAGVSVFGGVYIINAAVAGGIGATPTYDLFIPVFGPLVFMRHLDFGGSDSALSTLVITPLVIDFMAQAAGVAMLIAGVATKKEVTEYAVVPVVRPDFTGLAFSGRF